MTLPRNWHSIDALYAALNDPRRIPTPQSTIEAILYAVRQRGVAALRESGSVERLARCDRPTRQQINDRIAKLLEGKAA